MQRRTNQARKWGGEKPFSHWYMTRIFFVTGTHIFLSLEKNIALPSDRPTNTAPVSVPPSTEAACACASEPPYAPYCATDSGTDEAETKDDAEEDEGEPRLDDDDDE